MTERALKPGWKLWRFDQMAVNINDRVDNPSEAGVERYVGLEHLDSDSLKIRRWGSPTDVEATKLRFRKGDIILGRRRVYQRKLAVADFEGICSAHAMVLRARSDIVLPEFLPFFMQSDLFMNRALEISVGSLSPTINWSTLAQQEFALPPVEEQRRISDLLTNSSNLLEAIIDLKKQVNLTYLSSINHFITGLYNRNNKNSNLITLNECAKVTDCKHQTPTFSDEGIPYVAPGNIDWGPIDFQSCKKVSIEEYNKLMEHVVVTPGDLILSRNQTYGIASYFNGDSSFVIGQDTVLIQERIYPTDMIYIMLRSSPIQKQIRQKSMGTTFKRINLADIRKLLLPQAEKPDFEKASTMKNEFEEKIVLVNERLKKYRLFRNQTMNAIQLSDISL